MNWLGAWSFAGFYLFLKVAFCSDESGCIELSKFDYEFRIVQKMAQMESHKNEMDINFEKIESQISSLRASVAAFEAIVSPITTQIEMIDTLQEKIARLEETKGNSASMYVRWGRSDCPGNGTDLVYDGYVGGSHYTHTGAAVDRLCLPKDPTWDQYDENTAAGAKLYGGEYQLDVGSSSKSAKYFGSNLSEHDPVCAVCLSSRPNVIMIPGSNTCYPGWTEEYSGYLTAGHYSHKAASQYVCLDKNAQVRHNGRSGQAGALFYMVEAECGSLPCPPYVQGREITCVVCTK